MKKEGIYFILTGFILALLYIPLEFFEVDLPLQQLLFDQTHKIWKYSDFWGQWHNLIYHGSKYLTMIIGISVIITLIFATTRYSSTWPTQNKKRLLITALSIIIAPTLIVLLKDITNVQCPWSLKIFGGEHEFVKIWNARPESYLHARGKCFPGGRASGTFALIALSFLFKKTRAKAVALSVTLFLAAFVSFYQMQRGAHFLTHQLATASLSFILIGLIAYIVDKFYKSNNPTL